MEPRFNYAKASPGISSHAYVFKIRSRMWTAGITA
jgi:hypothetical protein